MKGKKLLAGALSAAMVLGTMVMPAFAESVSVTDGAGFKSAIVSGNAISLENDITCDGSEWGFVTGISNLTINGNNHTITFDEAIDSGSNGNAIIHNGTSLNVSDLTIKFPDGDTTSNGFYASNSTFDNVTIHNGYAGILNNQNVTIKNCNFKNQDYISIYSDDTGNTTGTKIENCTFTDTRAYIARSNEVITGNVVKLEQKTDVWALTVAPNATATIKRNLLPEGTTLELYQNSSTIENNAVLGNISAGSDVAEGTVDTVRNDNMTSRGDIEADLNGVPFETFEAAFRAANDGDTITLYKNATLNDALFGSHEWVINKNFNLNGYKLTVDAAYGYTSIRGNFEIIGDDDRNSTLELTTTSTTGDVLFGIGYAVAGNNNVKMSGLTITTPETYNASCGVIGVQGNSTLEMDNVKVDIGSNNSDGYCEGIFYGNPTENNVVKLNDVDITTENTNAVFYGFKGVDFDDVTFEGKVNEWIFSCVSGNIENSTFTYTNTENESTRAIARDFKEGNIAYTISLAFNDVDFNNVPNCTDGVLNVSNTTSSITADADTTFDTEQTVMVAKIGNVYYATLKEALTAANDGDTITLLADAENVKTAEFTPGERKLTFDLNGHTLFFDTAGQASVLVSKDLKFMSTGDEKGTIDFTNASVGQAIFLIMNENTTVTLDNVNLVGNPTRSSGAGFFQSNYLEGAKVIFNNSTVTLTGAVTSEEGVEPKVYDRASFFVNAVDAEFNNTTVSVTGFDGVFTHGNFTLNNGSDITVENGNHALNYARLKMNGNAKFEINGYHEDAIKLGEGSYIDLNDTSSLTIKDAAVDGVKDINYSRHLGADYDKSQITIDVAENAVLEADLSAVIDGTTVTGKANAISVKFDKVTDKEWNIVLTAPTELLIHEFTAAQLKFTKDAAAITYEIEGANDKIAVSEQGDNVYLFNLKSGAEIVGDKNEVVIGKVVFVDGYSDTPVNFRVDDSYADNKVTATKGQNITEVFTVSDGKLTIDADKIDISFPEPTCDVTINVAMNQEVTDHPAAFQKMTVVISGQNLDEPITYNLGSGNDEIAQANGVYKIKTGNKLKQNSKYMITVSGDGYRTGKYLLSIRDNDKATVNFWNNVQRTEKLEMETGNADSKAWANFIAGDIVKDNKLDIFDLSAVVAYFGESTTDTNNAWAMVKYDLNRDGIIDAEDVAYVMNAWSGLEKVNEN